MENKSLDNFEKYFHKLTAVQRSAVSWNEGALLVLAGPGSGKTRVLTCRIARILRESEGQKFRILGLTFTNKAADEMRARVEEMVPGMVKRVFLGTFHSFAADVLRQHGMHVGVQPDFKIYATDRDIESVMRGAIERAATKNQLVTTRDVAVLPVIKRLRSELVEPSNASTKVVDKNLKLRIADIYDSYEQELSANNALDFESLIYYAHKLFLKYPAFALRYQTVYKFWCLDEFQDTNIAQYSLIKIAARQSFKNLFVVADDDQVIYQWNGASHKRLEELRADFECSLVQLPTNYRCPAPIVALANKLISNNLLRTAEKKPLEAGIVAQADGNPISLLSFSSEDDEAQAIAEQIVKVPRPELGEVAVLARRKSLLENLASVLAAKKVPFILPQKKAEFTCAAFVWLHALLRQANDRKDSKNFEELTGSYRKLAPVGIDEEEAVMATELHRSDYLSEFLKLASEQLPAEVREQATLLQTRGEYKGVVKASLAWFQELQTRMGETEFCEGFFEDRAAWTELYREIKGILGNEAPLEAFLHELDLRSKEATPRKPSVSLLTIHAAKGKEFDHVYIMGMAEDVIPSFQSKKNGEYSPEMEEERRNCFVAITRTKKTLTLSYSRAYSGWVKPPSRFLREMGLIK